MYCKFKHNDDIQCSVKYTLVLCWLEMVVYDKTDTNFELLVLSERNVRLHLLY